MKVGSGRFEKEYFALCSGGDIVYIQRLHLLAIQKQHYEVFYPLLFAVRSSFYSGLQGTFFIKIA
ncbi:MAG TPA: hypothetical protein PKA53_13475 [Sphingobacterium sp.]|nr:hypothetical protein [Sphingobacterium sp.]